jgi:hypothetical protein
VTILNSGKYMTTTTYAVRLFGGRNVSFSFDSLANTITIVNQSINLSSLSAGLQAQFAAAVANSGVPNNVAAFGGDNVEAAIGAILDATPAWRSAIQATLAS